MRPTTLTRVVLAALLTGSPSAQGTVWIVDAAAANGSDFGEIQAAVDAAFDGDTILVRQGAYASFTVSAKALQVVAEEHAHPLVQELAAGTYTTVRVEDLAEHQSVVLRGFVIEPPPVVSDRFSPPGLEIANCAGDVWIEDVVANGNSCDECPGPTPIPFLGLRHSPSDRAAPGVVIRNADSVLVSRSKFIASSPDSGSSTGEFVSWDSEPADHGIAILDSYVTLYGSRFEGGFVPGGQCGGSPAAPTSHGALVQSSVVFASGSVFLGGEGGPGCLPALPGSPGENAKGGDGLHADALSEVTWQDCTFVGGDGALFGLNGEETFGPVSSLEGLARNGSLESPVRQGTSTTVEILGESGDIAALWFSQDWLGAFVEALLGVLLPGPDGQAILLNGAVPTLGPLKQKLPVGSLASGSPAASFYSQIVIAALCGEVLLGAPSSIAIIDGDLWPAPALGEGPQCLQSELAFHEPSDDRFGESIALTDQWMAVGVPEEDFGFSQNQGAVWIYEQDGPFWLPVQQLTGDGGSGDSARLGSRLSADGDWLAAGAPGDDSVYTYERTSDGSWTSHGALQPAGTLDATFSLCAERLAVVANAPFGAAPDVYVYLRTGSTWSLEQTIVSPATGSIDFGASIHLSPNRLIVGDGGAQPNPLGRAFVYELSQGSWTLTQTLASPGTLDNFGQAVLSAGERIYVGAPFHSVGALEFVGAVYVFESTSGSWTVTDVLEPQVPLDRATFGSTLAWSAPRLAVSAPGAFSSDVGRVFLYEEVGGALVPSAVVVHPTAEPNTQYSGAMGLLNDRLVTGAPGEDGLNSPHEGRVRTYSLAGDDCP